MSFVYPKNLFSQLIKDEKLLSIWLGTQSFGPEQWMWLWSHTITLISYKGQKHNIYEILPNVVQLSIIVASSTGYLLTNCNCQPDTFNKEQILQLYNKMQYISGTCMQWFPPKWSDFTLCGKREEFTEIKDKTERWKSSNIVEARLGFKDNNWNFGKLEDTGDKKMKLQVKGYWSKPERQETIFIRVKLPNQEIVEEKRNKMNRKKKKKTWWKKKKKAERKEKDKIKAK